MDAVPIRRAGARRSASPPRPAPPSDGAEAPEPVWAGPGTVVAIRMTDGRHRLGSARVLARMAPPEPMAGARTLRRLLAHYGRWLGFEGRAATLRAGRLRPLPAGLGAGPGAGIEYRVELCRIARAARTLAADGAVLADGRPVALLEGLTVRFRTPAPRPLRPAAPPAG